MSDPKETLPISREPVAASWFVGWLLGLAAIPLGMLVIMAVYHDDQPFPWCVQLSAWSRDAMVFALHAQFVAQLIYCAVGIALLRGYRFGAVLVTVLAIWLTGCAGLNAAMAITGGWF